MPQDGLRASALILVVDDDAGDQILIREALEGSRVRKRIQVAGDGEEALEYLYRCGRYAPPARAERPSLILLDLNMPRLGGKEVVARLKTDAALKQIPVVIFTTSCREQDAVECYAVGANSYVQKPADFDRLQEVLQHLAYYWLAVNAPAGASG